MEQSVVTAVFLPVALGIIMLGMGMTLSPSDFRRVVSFPKAAIIGLSTQLIMLPILGFGLAAILFDNPVLAVGFINYQNQILWQMLYEIRDQFMG